MIRTVPSCQQAASDEPSGEKARALTWQGRPSRVSSSCPEIGSHRWMLPDLPAAASVRPSGEKARQRSSSCSLCSGASSCSAGQVPPLDDAVLVGPGEGRGRRARRPPPRSSTPPVQVHSGLAAVDVPEPHGAVVADGGQRAAVGAEGDLTDRVRMAGQRPDATASGHVPEADGAVGAGGGEPAAVRAEGDGADLVRVAVERREQAPGRGIPEAEVLLRQQAGRREDAAAGLEGDGGGGGLVGLPAAQEPARRRVPELERLGIVGVVARRWRGGGRRSRTPTAQASSACPAGWAVRGRARSARRRRRVSTRRSATGRPARTSADRQSRARPG